RGDAVRPDDLDRRHARGHIGLSRKAETGLSRTLSPVSDVRTIDGQPPANGLRVAIVVSKYHDFVTDRLKNGALAALAKAGVATDGVTVVRVPGSFEVPAAAQHPAASG